MGFRMDVRRQRTVHPIHEMLYMSIYVFMMLMNDGKCEDPACLRMSERLRGTIIGGVMKTIWRGGP